MIQANELRIGNWIHNPIQQINFQVDLATIGNVMRDNDKRNKVPDYSLYKPIPITEEILLKCGFEKKPINKLFQFTAFEFKDFELFSDDDGYYFFCNDKYISILYVHQLQNVYSVVNNYKELEIKL